MEISGTSAVVTGAAGGIGAALAQRLLEGGAAVTITDLDASRLEASAQRLRDLGHERVIAVAGDASSEDDIAASIAAAEEAHGPVDVYAANAGVGDGSGLSATEAQWDLALDVNVRAHVRAARQLVPGWVERGQGCFVSTASAAGLLTQLGSATYSVSKHGAVAFAEWLAITYGDQGVHVSCLCPMGVDTEMLRTGMSPDAGDGGALAAAAVTGAGDVLDPLVVADAVVAALADETFFVLPHAEVAEYQRRKVDDHDRWIRGMQRYNRTLEGR